MVVDLNDVQGDIILGIPKRVEDFIFFTIAKGDKVASFRKIIGSKQFIKYITSTANIQDFRQNIKNHKSQCGEKPTSLIPFAGVNIAFTQSGLNLVGLTDDIGDPAFTAGQLAHAQNLGDGKIVNNVFDPSWLPEFMGDIHGIILIAGDCEKSIKETRTDLLSLLGNTVNQVFNVHAKTRPGDQKGHEHFGYMDNISLPAVKGIVSPNPGQRVIDPGVLLMGQPGDPVASARPTWSKNGSILVYRHFHQLVPEYNQFKRDNALFPEELGIEKGAELLGARLFGRWKSGAPIDLSPTYDDPALAADPLRNNNFDFSTPQDQTNCPFAAHIRKTNPRSDLGNAIVASHTINRTGITFGEEVTPAEHSQHKTEHDRGLSFVCYQSDLSKGFEFMQESWVNNTGFIFGKEVNGKPFNPGFDPIIGQINSSPREMGGYDPNAQANNLLLPVEFVISKGGAYFFSPSISTLKTKIGTYAEIESGPEC